MIYGDCALIRRRLYLDEKSRGRRVALSAFVQYEQWKFPVLSAPAQANADASVHLSVYSNWSDRK
jgi:hypothetical protein